MIYFGSIFSIILGLTLAIFCLLRLTDYEIFGGTSVDSPTELNIKAFIELVFGILLMALGFILLSI